MKKSTVSITRCPDYSLHNVAVAIGRVMDHLPDTNDLLSTGKTVLLKPNLLSATQPLQNAVNTHPAVIKSIASFCSKRGCRVMIGDSCGSLSKGSTRKALENSGVMKIAKETASEVINFDTSPFEEIQIPGGKVLKTINITGAVLDADVIITIPKLKTHGLTMLTGAVKNQFGCVPGGYKKRIHMQAPKPDRLSEAVVDVFSIARPHIALMDAVTAMEGNGPAGGRPRNAGLVLASTDSVALDAVAGDIIGYRPGQVMTTAFAAMRGLGVDRLGEIDVRGEKLEQAAIDDFRRPSSGRRKWLWRITPSVLTRHIIKNMTPQYPVVLHEDCVGCGECIVNCPADALKLNSGHVSLTKERCIGCYCCSEACPHAAIEFRRSGLLRIFS